MNMKVILASIVVLAAIGAGCKSDEEEQNLGPAFLLLAAAGNQDEVEDTVESAMDSIADGMGELKQGGSSFAMRDRRSYTERAADWLYARFDNSLMAATERSCAQGGSIDRTTVGADFPSPSDPLNVVRSYQACTFFFGWTLNGQSELRWEGLNTVSPFVQAGATLERAPQLSLTTRRGYTVSVSGNGAVITGGTLPISHSLSWSDADNYSMDVTVTRTGVGPFGRGFTHTVTTPTPLAITSNIGADTRTINSGVHRIVNAQGLTVDVTYSSVVWNLSSCRPESGTASFSYSGPRTGTGTITFNGDGTASYEYSGTRGSGSGVVNISGCG